MYEKRDVKEDRRARKMCNKVEGELKKKNQTKQRRRSQAITDFTTSRHGNYILAKAHQDFRIPALICHPACPPGSEHSTQALLPSLFHNRGREGGAYPSYPTLMTLHITNDQKTVHATTPVPLTTKTYAKKGGEGNDPCI